MAGQEEKRLGEKSLPDLPSRSHMKRVKPPEEKREVSRSKGLRRKAEELSERQFQADSFTPEVVSTLLEEAAVAALGPSREAVGAAANSSQFLRDDVQRIIRDRLQASSTDIKVGDLGELFQQVMHRCRQDESCRLQPMAGNRSLFPLPVSTCLEQFPNAPPFLQALACGLNDLHGVEDSTESRGNPTSLRAMKNLAATAASSEILEETIPKIDFKEFLKHRKVDYRGEEIKVAKKLKWSSVEPSLPKEVGQLCLRDFCEDGVLHFVDNFPQFLLDEDEQVVGKTPTTMVDPDDWVAVAEGLVSRGICGVLRDSEVHRVRNQKLLNGMFSVSKQEWVGDIEITRLIMNLRPTNANSKALTGDTATLPSVTSLGAIFLDDGESILTCSEDIRCFFYLFAVPEAWWPFLAFGKEAPKSITPKEFGDEPGFLFSKVLPMGYINSVAIAQHIHRVVVRRSLSTLRPTLGGEAELRRDRVFSQSEVLFRIYLDNFDLLTKCSPDLATEIEGKASEVVMRLRETYMEVGLPRHPKKAVENARQAEIQGAWVDGQKGTACAKPSKVVKYIALALDMLGRCAASQRELQVLGGGFVYVAMFRRPLLCSLNNIWTQITDMEGVQTHVRWWLRKEVIGEVARFLCLLPLASMNMRLKFDPLVTASGASTQGGGLCMSRGLTPYGMAASLSKVRGEIPEEHDFSQVLSVGLFDGIAALRVALDCLHLPMAGHVSVEKSPEARRVVEAAFPDCIMLDDVELITLEVCQGWALRFPGVGIVIIGAGPPCQGVSGLNSDRKGALRDERSSLFYHVPRVVELCKLAFPWAQVHSLGENVASMDYADCEAMNEEYQCEPLFIDAHGIGLCHRPRLYWISWEVSESEGVQFLEGSDGRLPIKGEMKLECQVEEQAFLEAG